MNELLIVITLVGMSAAIGVQSFRGYLASQRAREGAVLVRSALNTAKGRAAATNRVARVDFSARCSR